MRHSLIALAAVVGSLMAVSAAPAMGAIHWSDTSKGIKVSGSLTAKKGGGSAITCTVAAGVQSSEFFGQEGWLWNNEAGELRFNCSNGKQLGMLFAFQPVNTTTLNVGSFSETLAKDPWGGALTYYKQGYCVGTPCLSMVGDFKNGSGATSSTVTFSNDALGSSQEAGSPQITLTGSLKVTNSSGGLLTLLP